MLISRWMDNESMVINHNEILSSHKSITMKYARKESQNLIINKVTQFQKAKHHVFSLMHGS